MVAGSEHGIRGGAQLSYANAPDWLFSFDLRGKLIAASEQLELLLGYSQPELCARGLSELMEAEGWQALQQNTLEQVGGAQGGPLLLSFRTKAGPFAALDVVNRLVFEKGQPVAVRAFGRNLAEASLYEVPDVEERLSFTTRQLTLFTQHLKQLHRLGTTSYKSLEQVFSDYLQTGSEVFELPLGTILQLQGEELVVRAMHGESAGLREGVHLNVHETPFASVTDRLRTLTRFDSLDSDGAAVRPELQVCIATPILVDHEIFATLCFSGRSADKRGGFSREKRDVIELMAGSIGRFVLESRIHAERQQAARLEREHNLVLEMVAEGRPLPETLASLARLIEDQCPQSQVCILVQEDGYLAVKAAPSLPWASTRACEDKAKQCALLEDGQRAFAAGLGMQAVFCGPIFSGRGILLGQILLLYAQADMAGGREQSVLTVASRLAGIAIEQAHLVERLAFQAQHDFLTGLPNRFRLLELLEQRLGQAQTEGASTPAIVSVLFIDLDRFKQINDTLGHAVGDRLLLEVGERLRSGLKHPADIAARLGGDEFAVILCSAQNEPAVVRAAHAFLELLRQPYLIDGRELFVTASIGVSCFPKHGDSASTLLRKADAAMYRAKKEGKNAIECFVSDSQSGAMEKLELENALRRALEKAEFELFFQPIVSMNGDLDGFEVLLAWNHATRGRISPNQFIPMAEETGLIVPIGTWVLQAACERGAGWLKAGYPLQRVSVNVSALQFARPNFVETVATVLSKTGFPPRLLELELTESLVLQDIGDSIHRMEQLQALGVTMAIDDFGTGYSSLSYLRRLPINELKIDQSFLRDVQSAAQNLAVIQTIVALAHRMKLSVVAEGVETLEELEVLRAAGCDRVQGHLYGRSLRAHEVEVLLARPDRKVPLQPPRQD